MLIAIIILIIQGLVFGFATQSIIENKGYYENWFWWGFFFGILAVLVALSKPESRAYDSSNVDYLTGVADTFSVERDKKYTSRVIEAGGWKCHFCNRTNPSYTGTCACGKTKEDTQNFETARIQQLNEIKQKTNKEDSLDKLKKLKELLDMGALTQEEFDLKKKELLEEPLK